MSRLPWNYVRQNELDTLYAARVRRIMEMHRRESVHEFAARAHDAIAEWRAEVEQRGQ